MCQCALTEKDASCPKLGLILEPSKEDVYRELVNSEPRSPSFKQASNDLPVNARMVLEATLCSPSTTAAFAKECFEELDAALRLSLHPACKRAVASHWRVNKDLNSKDDTLILYIFTYIY